MATYNWTPGGQQGGCPGADKYITPGWYLSGQAAPGVTPLATSYLNPSTGKAWTPAELGGVSGGGGGTTPTGGGTVVAGPTEYTAPTLEEGVGPGGLTYAEYLAQAPEGMSEADVEAHWLEMVGKPQHVGETRAETGPGAIPGEAPITIPTFGDISVPAPAVTPAPPYEPSEAQLAWQEQFGGKLEDWMEAGGYGIPEETQALMTQQLTDTLKAKETEDIRVMRNNMERRGITNSGFVFSNEQKIRSGTTMALAKSITDIKIQSALMKMASFEKAMGATALFLGYLSEQSQLQYQPQYQTWMAQQQATLYQYQAKMDLYKTQLQQAYAQQNLILAGQIQADAAAQQNIWDMQMLEMEIEASQQAAAAEGFGNLLGTLLMLPFMFM